VIDYAAGGVLLDSFVRALARADGDALVAIFTEDAEYHGDPFGEPLVGHNALRAYLLESAATRRDVDITIERHWVSGSTVLASWHASWTRSMDGSLMRAAGFITAEIAPDGRIGRYREWRMMSPTSAG
jgi:ketosteroid isomerase-like protein